MDAAPKLFEKKDLDENYLPLNVDIVAYAYYLKDNAHYHSKFKSLYTLMTTKIVNIWEKTKIPICGNKHVKSKIDGILKCHKKVKRDIRAGNAESKYILDQLFNITHCQCQNFDYCECVFRENISDHQYEFLLNQTSSEEKIRIDEYLSQVSDIQGHETSPNVKVMPPPPPSLRLPSRPLALSPPLSPPLVLSPPPSPPSPLTAHLSREDQNDPDYQAEYTIPQHLNLPKSINELNTDGVLIDSMRFSASYRSIAAIMNRTMEAFGAITVENKGLVITESFLRKRSAKLGCKIADSWKEKCKQRPLKCFFFDGVSMRNKMTIEKANKKFIDNSVLYDNIAVVEQPNDGNGYLGFVSSPNSDAESIFQKLLEFFKQNERDLNSLFVIGCDGAATNVGIDNGIIRKFEELLHVPLHRIVCLLHLLELILKAVISIYFGDNINTYKSTTQITVALENCHKFPVKKFTKVQLKNMPLINGSFDESVLNHDQKYLYDIAKGVNDGNINENLAAQKPGDMSTLRWTATGSRLLRLYISSDAPSDKLVSVVKFIQTVYIPMLFQIKLNPDWTHGSIHLYNMLIYSQCLGQKTFDAVKKRAQFNSFFAHSEILLLCMISDVNKQVRSAAYKIILSKRDEIDTGNQDGQSIRVFNKPEIAIEFDGKYKHYTNIIDWNKENVYEPPFTRNLTKQQLIQYMDSDDIIEIPSIPSHSQYTESCVQSIKRAVVQYVGHESQDQKIQQKIIGRSLNKNSASGKKSNFQLFSDCEQHM
jgi:hypothetical protein